MHARRCVNHSEVHSSSGALLYGIGEGEVKNQQFVAYVLPLLTLRFPPPLSKPARTYDECCTARPGLETNNVCRLRSASMQNVFQVSQDTIGRLIILKLHLDKSNSNSYCRYVMQ